MRTREEQIIECAQHLISMRRDCKSTEYDLVERIINEAEQRVRAEIGRDSERLDWLCRNIKGSESRRMVGVIADTGCVDLWRAAIDVAREIANV